MYATIGHNNPQPEFVIPQYLKVHLDFETGSACDLTKSGVHRYAEDPSTRIWTFSYWFETEQGYTEMRQWRPGMPDPVDLLHHVAMGRTFCVHNAMFERWIWNLVLRNKYNLQHWPMLSPYQQDCTMSRAAAIAHPQSLERLGAVLRVKEQKDIDGAKVMQRMMKPRKWGNDGTYEWWDAPADIDRLSAYCDQDIRAESEIDKRLPPLTDSERKVWILDQIVNDRGIHIDIAAATRCVELVDHAKKMADSEMRTLTGRTVPKCSNDAKLIAWVQSQGIECDTVKKGVQDDLMFMADLHDKPIVREVIELRRASKKTSTAKYAAMLKCVSSDNRVRGLLNYHGAATGRWAGRLIQPQNLPRVDFDEEGYIIEWMHSLLADKTLTVKEIYDAIVVVHGPSAPLALLSRALRSMVTAAPGKKLVGGDFSNIEGRINAWFAGEQWKLQAFRDYDTIIPGEFDKKGKPKRAGPDLYNLAYAKSFLVAVESVTGKQRQIGKVEELALGYQGAHGAVLTMGDTYGLDPYVLARAVAEATRAEVWDATAAKYHEKGTNHFDLQEREWTAIKVLVDSWRSANSKIVQGWWDLQDAAIAAVETPGYISYAYEGKTSYYSDGNYLWNTIPGGRMLCYTSPELRTTKVERQRADGSTYTTYKKSVSFWGIDEGRWTSKYLYGGLQCENIVQASARDVMCDRMFAAEREGFPLILTVHDELLTEPDLHSKYHNSETLQRIMSVVPPAFAGLPLAAAAWEDQRYVK